MHLMYLTIASLELHLEFSSSFFGKKFFNNLIKLVWIFQVYVVFPFGPYQQPVIISKGQIIKQMEHTSDS